MTKPREAYPETGSLLTSDLPPVDGWSAWHVFLYDFGEQDAFLHEVVAPLLEGMKARQGETFRWFYIRYWENGSHLRLRFRHLGRSDFEDIGRQLLASVERFAGTPSASMLQASASPSAGGSGGPEIPVLFPAGTVAEIAYEPETRRYGGRQCIRGCEDAFEVSSSIALHFLGSDRATAAGRRGLGLLLTAIGAAMATSNEMELSAFMAETQSTWAHYLGDLVSGTSSPHSRAPRSQEIAHHVLSLALASREGQIPNDPLAGQWTDLLVAEKERMTALHVLGALVCPRTGAVTRSDHDRDRAIASIFSSYNHMMMNRLGITPALEYEFASLLAEALASSPSLSEN
ncbi:thiopeptide-type bacteriocin biosynthesis protein [Parerythrobacter aestuarii]|uniref:thiopeptide-type bacteriocin biosynthesis protein n=1 Tax=Parerythrobacter aestuarii TaxID=3020909 RepID=UPI0024DE1242|nr:thiopeptide-type bacteriocin biosynthesis protein [Parerythrobacter aestuarii]